MQVAAAYVLHVGQPEGLLRVGDSVTATIDGSRRGHIASNHTMTHVLNYGLREVRLRSLASQALVVTFSRKPAIVWLASGSF